MAIGRPWVSYRLGGSSSACSRPSCACTVIALLSDQMRFRWTNNVTRQGVLEVRSSPGCTGKKRRLLSWPLSNCAKVCGRTFVHRWIVLQLREPQSLVRCGLIFQMTKRRRRLRISSCLDRSLWWHQYCPQHRPQRRRRQTPSRSRELRRFRVSIGQCTFQWPSASL